MSSWLTSLQRGVLPVHLGCWQLLGRALQLEPSLLQEAQSISMAMPSVARSLGYVSMWDISRYPRKFLNQLNSSGNFLRNKIQINVKETAVKSLTPERRSAHPRKGSTSCNSSALEITSWLKMTRQRRKLSQASTLRKALRTWNQFQMLEHKTQVQKLISKGPTYKIICNYSRKHIHNIFFLLLYSILKRHLNVRKRNRTSLCSQF